MSCWHTTISAYLLFFCQIFICVTALHDLSRTEIPLKLCSGCYHYPSPNTNSSQPPVSGFTAILNLNGSNVAIGAKNSLVILSLDGKLRHITKINSTKDAFIKCKKRQTNSELCPNIINLVIQHKGLIVACGTNSDSPQCWKVNETTILAHFTPKEYYTKEFKYLKTDSYLYTAYSNRNGKGKMYKVNIDSPSDFLYMGVSIETSPHFVSLYEFGNYVYYFFTELPEEIPDTVNKEPFSRVGRLCKYDTGGKDNYEKRITLFSKARLLCEKPGSKYNFLEATSFVKENGHVYIYGIFRSMKSSSESAVCRFSLSAIDTVFDSKTTKFYGNPPSKSNPPSKRNDNDPRFLTCDSSLNTKEITKDHTTLSVTKPLAAEAIKADGNKPVFEVDVIATPHIISENLPTKSGSYHVIHVLDSNVMTDFAAPVKQPGQEHVLDKRKICKNALQVKEVKKVKGLIFVAAENKVIMVPDAFCQVYNSCRDCVASRNPYCAWDNNRNQCTKFNHPQSSIYAQDIEQGNYSQVCEKVKASCELILQKLPIPNRDVVLSCKIYGVPIIKVVSWQKDGKTLRVGLEMAIHKVNERQLVIKSYDLSEAGIYTCRVSNDITSGNCSATLLGSKPQLQSILHSKGDTSMLSCNATGYPKPTVVIKVFANSGRLRHSYSKNNIKIIRGQRYQCLANNFFGAVMGDTYQIHSTLIEFKIMKDWKSSYAKPKSDEYSKLALQLESEVNKLYKNVNIFKGISDIKFWEGSVMASFNLNGLANSSFQETEFADPIRNAIKKKHLGDLDVRDIGTPELDTQSTSKPLTTTARPSYSSSTSYTIPPGTPKIECHKEERSSSRGLNVGVVVVIVICLFLLAFPAGALLGYYCHMKQWMSNCLTKCFATSNSQKEQGTSDLSRSKKERESQRKLLSNVDGGKEVSRREKKGNCNEPTDSKRSSQILKHASIEIETDVIDDGKEHDVKYDQSVC